MQEATAKKLLDTVEPADAIQSAASSAERQVAALLREIEGDDGAHAPAMVLPTPSRHTADHLLRGFVVTDCLALLTGFGAAWVLTAVVNATFYARAVLNPADSTPWLLALQFLTIASGVILWFGYSNHYQARLPFWTETKKIAEVIGFAMLVNCFLQFTAKQDFSRLWLISYCVFAIIGTVAFRAMWRSAMRRRGKWQIATIIIGGGATAAELTSVLQAEGNLGYQITGQIRDLATAYKMTGHSWQALCQKYKANHVIIALDGEDLAVARPALAQLAREHVPFAVAPPVHNLSVVGAIPHSFLGRDVILLARNSGLDRPLYRFMKRCFDVTVATLALVALSPVILLLALLVRRDGGQAFYRHKRIGRDGKVFACLKLRSMIAQSDSVLGRYLKQHPAAMAEWQRDHKLRDDPRVTKVGAFLRRTSFDELPQLLNVIKGEMSIVGPRPIIVAETAKYDNDIAFYYRVRPGITGLWQVSGRNDVSYAERVRMDSWYVRNWSLWNDIAIVCKTFGVVLNRQGAY